MGASIVQGPSSIPADSREEFNDLLNQQVDHGFELTSAVYENFPDDVQSISLHGNIQRSEFASSLEDSADLKAFQIRAENGRLLTYEFDSGVTTIREISRRIEARHSDFPEWRSLYLCGLCILYGFKLVDDFIEQNGLRPVVDEVYRRKWSIMVGLMILAIIK